MHIDLTTPHYEGLALTVEVVSHRAGALGTRATQTIAVTAPRLRLWLPQAEETVVRLLTSSAVEIARTNWNGSDDALTLDVPDTTIIVDTGLANRRVELLAEQDSGTWAVVEGAAADEQGVARLTVEPAARDGMVLRCPNTGIIVRLQTDGPPIVCMPLGAGDADSASRDGFPPTAWVLCGALTIALGVAIAAALPDPDADELRDAYDAIPEMVRGKKGKAANPPKPKRAKAKAAQDETIAHEPKHKRGGQPSGKASAPDHSAKAERTWKVIPAGAAAQLTTAQSSVTLSASETQPEVRVCTDTPDPVPGSTVHVAGSVAATIGPKGLAYVYVTHVRPGSWEQEPIGRYKSDEAEAPFSLDVRIPDDSRALRFCIQVKRPGTRVAVRDLTIQ